MQNIVLINGRFELLNSPDRIDLFDIKNMKKHGEGQVIPVAVIPLDTPLTEREAGKRALSWLVDSGYLTRSEFFQFKEIFLTAQPLDGTPKREIRSFRE